MSNIATDKALLKEKIIDIAIQQFKHKGIKCVKMDDIAHLLGMSKRTLYLYFPDKEQLLLESIKRGLLSFQTYMKELCEREDNVIVIMFRFFNEQVEELKSVSPQFFLDLDKYPRVAKYLAEEQNSRQAHTRKLIQRGLEQGYFRKDINYELVLKMGSDTLISNIFEKRLYDLFSLQEIVSNIVFLFIRGFCTQQGIELLDKLRNNQPITD